MSDTPPWTLARRPASQPDAALPGLAQYEFRRGADPPVACVAATDLDQLYAKYPGLKKRIVSAAALGDLWRCHVVPFSALSLSLFSLFWFGEQCTLILFVFSQFVWRLFLVLDFFENNIYFPCSLKRFLCTVGRHES